MKTNSTRPFGWMILWLCLFLLTGPARAAGLTIGGETYQIELATTVEQRRLGLMHRPSIGSREGMLLVYPQAGNHRIWMKNVLIPLKVYWIDEDYTVISSQRLMPCVESSCPIYSADGESRYVLELGDYDHAIEVGDRLLDLARD